MRRSRVVKIASIDFDNFKASDRLSQKDVFELDETQHTVSWSEVHIFITTNSAGKSTRRLELVVVFRGMNSSYIRQQTSVRTLIYYVNTHNDDDSLILTSRQRPSTFFTILHTPSRAEKKKTEGVHERRASFLSLKFTLLIRSIFFFRKKCW